MPSLAARSAARALPRVGPSQLPSTTVENTRLSSISAVAGGTRPRILVVDDLPENIHALLHVLSPSCDILAATSASRALKVARSQTPDLILLDVVMPERSGYDLCRELKLDPRTADIPVIFISSVGGEGEHRKGLEAGAADYLSKPLDAELVRLRVHSQIELQRLRLATLRQQQTEQQQLSLEAELDTARQLQLSLVPAGVCDDPRLGAWQLSAHLRPARAVGGDLYDYFFIGKHKLLFALGDVSDKGVPAALFMVQVRTLLRIWGRTISCPAQLLETLNRCLCEDNDSGMFVTMVCGVVDLRTGRVALASAGHEAPLLVDTDGTARFQPMDAAGALGLWKNQRFPRHELQLQPRQALAFYTDGLTEALSEAGQAFGSERLLTVAGSARAQSAAALTDAILADHRAFSGSQDPFDDLALLTIRRPAEPLQQITLHSPAQLPELHTALRDCLSCWRCGAESSHDLILVAEEMAVNALRHGQPTQVSLSWRMVGDFLELRVSDDGLPFDPTCADPEQFGAGLTLVSSLTDHLSYRRLPDANSTLLRVRDRPAPSPGAPTAFFRR